MRHILTALSLILLISCNRTDKNLEEAQQQYADLKKQTLEVHDEIMPQTSELMELSYELTTVLESGLDSITDGASSREELLMAQQNVEEAHDAMMEWMRDYSEKFPYEEELPATMDELNKKMEMLQEEYDEVNKVGQMTEEALQVARAEMEVFPQIQAKGEVEPVPEHDHSDNADHEH